MPQDASRFKLSYQRSRAMVNKGFASKAHTYISTYDGFRKNNLLDFIFRLLFFKRKMKTF